MCQACFEFWSPQFRENMSEAQRDCGVVDRLQFLEVREETFKRALVEIEASLPIGAASSQRS